MYLSKGSYNQFLFSWNIVSNLLRTWTHSYANVCAHGNVYVCTWYMHEAVVLLGPGCSGSHHFDIHVWGCELWYRQLFVSANYGYRIYKIVCPVQKWYIYLKRGLIHMRMFVHMVMCMCAQDTCMRQLYFCYVYEFALRSWSYARSCDLWTN